MPRKKYFWLILGWKCQEKRNQPNVILLTRGQLPKKSVKRQRKKRGVTMGLILTSKAKQLNGSLLLVEFIDCRNSRNVREELIHNKITQKAKGRLKFKDI